MECKVEGGVLAEWSRAGAAVVRVWVQGLVVALVSFSKTLYHNCLILWMGRKALVPCIG